MLLQRTDKARQELQPGVRTLGLKERSLLLLADGHKPLGELQQLFEGQGAAIVADLLQRGYLQGARPAAAAPVPPPPASHAPASHAPASHAPASPNIAAPQPAAVDPFEGKRSLATTRMFLFDLCERMFARRDPARAEQFRQALRNARDRESMLAAAREMLGEIERTAGPERADSIGERIAMLLPPETV